MPRNRTRCPTATSASLFPLRSNATGNTFPPFVWMVTLMRLPSASPMASTIPSTVVLFLLSLRICIYHLGRGGQFADFIGAACTSGFRRTLPLFPFVFSGSCSGFCFVVWVLSISLVPNSPGEIPACAQHHALLRIPRSTPHVGGPRVPVRSSRGTVAFLRDTPARGSIHGQAAEPCVPV